MANTATRPTVGQAVTYVDPNGNEYPALAMHDYGSSIDLEMADPNNNPADNYEPGSLTQPTRGRKIQPVDNVPDQGNNPGALTVATSVTAGSTSGTASSATGIPASGYAAGPGVVPGTTYTISGTTVTFSAAIRAGSTNSAAPISYSANAIVGPYWRYPAAYVL